MLACAPVEKPAPEPAVAVETVSEPPPVDVQPVPEAPEPVEEVKEEPKPPEQIIEPIPQPAELSCMEECEAKCVKDADNACSEPFNRDCKQKCGTIIDPSACSTACSFDKRNCIPFFEKTCKNTCVQICN